MIRTDVNCMIGHWPYRRLYKSNFEDLKKVHRDNNISSGYVSYIDSIFYNDPFEGEEELHEIIKGSSYHHILTINPLMPGFLKDVEKGNNLFNIKGVKIYPGYHGYSLDDIMIDNLCSVLRKLKLPLFVVLRMEDERLNYMFKPRSISQEEVSRFIRKNSDIKIILLNANIYELLKIKDDINSSDNIFFDTSGLKGSLFPIENLLEVFEVKKILYGSLHPLYCLKSTLLSVEMAQIGEMEKEKIISENWRVLE